MNPQLTPQDEEDLIAFHLGEACDEAAVQRRLDADAAYAELSASVAHTLRVFSAEPVPAPDVDAAWANLRNALPVLAPQSDHRWLRWPAFLPAAAVALLAMFAGLFFWHRHRAEQQAVVLLQSPPATIRSEMTDPMAVHLDQAERWLTVVHHAAQPIDETTQYEGRQLLLHNANYLNTAHTRGDLADAAVLERLGRVLTIAEHPEADTGWHVRFQMNTDGLLLDIRILRQNQSQTNRNERSGDYQ